MADSNEPNEWVKAFGLLTIVGVELASSVLIGIGLAHLAIKNWGAPEEFLLAGGIVGFSGGLILILRMMNAQKTKKE